MESVAPVITKALLVFLDPLLGEELRNSASVDTCILLLQNHLKPDAVPKLSGILGLLLEELVLDCLLEPTTLRQVLQFILSWIEAFPCKDTVLSHLVAAVRVDGSKSILSVMLETETFAIPRLLKGASFTEILKGYNLFIFDRQLRSLFPILRSIEANHSSDMVYRITEPIRTMVLLNAGNFGSKVTRTAISKDVQDLVSRYLDILRPTNLTRPPPSS